VGNLGSGTLNGRSQSLVPSQKAGIGQLLDAPFQQLHSFRNRFTNLARCRSRHAFDSTTLGAGGLACARALYKYGSPRATPHPGRRKRAACVSAIAEGFVAEVADVPRGRQSTSGAVR
jgi:hypothetical protein